MIEILYATLKKRYISTLSDIINICDSASNDMVSIGLDYFYDQFNKQLYYNDNAIKLSKNEHALLEVLIEAKGKGIPYKTMEYRIWQGLPIQSHSLRSLVYRFRIKTNDDIIETLASFGYKLPYLNTN
jgi:DNA-binding response OmpR family regulator